MQDLHEIGGSWVLGFLGSWYRDFIFIFAELEEICIKNLSLAVNDAAEMDGMHASLHLKIQGFFGISLVWLVFLIF